MIARIALFLFILTPEFSYAIGGISQLLPPTTAQNDTSLLGGTTWVNSQNILAEDATLSTATMVGNVTTRYVNSSTYNFAIPLTSQITGIVVEVKKMKTLGTVKDNSVVVYDSAGNPAANDLADLSTPWPSSLAWVSYGSSTNLWGNSWKPSDINSSNFGFGIQAYDGGTDATAEIDAVRMTVYYLPPTQIYNGKIHSGIIR